MSRSLLTALVLASLVVPAFGQPPKEKGPYRPRNDLISDFADNPAQYEGKILTFRLKYADNPGGTLKTRAGMNGVPFKGVDPNNGAKLLLGLEIPRDITLPAAMNDEELIVTFKALKFKTSDGYQGQAVEIRRPNAKDAELKGAKP